MPRQDLFQPRRGTSAQWATADPVLAMGEPGLDTDTGVEKIGDGVTAWSALPAAGGGGGGGTLVVPDGTEYDDVLVTFADLTADVTDVSLVTDNGNVILDGSDLTVVGAGLYRFELMEFAGTYLGEQYHDNYGVRVTYGSDFWAGVFFAASGTSPASVFLDRRIESAGSNPVVLPAGQVLVPTMQSLYGEADDASFLSDISEVTDMSATFRVTKVIGA